MESNMFLHIDGIPGGSEDESHKDWIEILSWSFGVHQMGEGGKPSQRANFHDFTVSKIWDMASLKLVEACIQNKPLGKIEINTCRYIENKQQKYIKFKLTKCYITSISAGAGGDGKPLVDFTFSFEELEKEHTPMSSDGKTKGKIGIKHSLRKGKGK